MSFTKVSLLLTAVVFLLTSSFIKADLPPSKDSIDDTIGFAYSDWVPPPFQQPVGQPTSLAETPPKPQPIGFAMDITADKRLPPIGVAMEAPIEIGQQPPPVAMPPIPQPISYPFHAIEMPPIGNPVPPFVIEPSGYGIPQPPVPPIGQPVSSLGFPSPVFSPVSIESATTPPSDVPLSQPPTEAPSFLATMKPTQSPTKKTIRKMCRRRKLKIRINPPRNQRRISAQDKMNMMRKKMARKMKA